MYVHPYGCIASPTSELYDAAARRGEECAVKALLLRIVLTLAFVVGFYVYVHSLCLLICCSRSILVFTSSSITLGRLCCVAGLRTFTFDLVPALPKAESRGLL